MVFIGGVFMKMCCCMWCGKFYRLGLYKVCLVCGTVLIEEEF